MTSSDPPSSPAGPPDPDASSPEAAAPPAVSLRRGDRARQALVAPWSRERARRVRLVALLLGVLGPLVGTAIALVLVPAEPGDVLPFDDEQAAVIDATGTVRGVDPVTGELALRLRLDRSDTVDRAEEDTHVIAENGTLNEPLTLVVQSANGQFVQELPERVAPGTFTIALGLTDSRATRYPLDRYRATVFVAVLRPSSDDEPDMVPLRLSLRSSDPGFTVDVVDKPSGDTSTAVADLRVARRWTVIGWAGFFVLVCWMLAISAASIGWTTVVHGITSPAWAWGFLIGVLFALPPLRDALPGAPPSGSLVDLAAFYWAVGIVALTLVMMIGSWNVRVRRAPDEPDAPRPRA